MSKKQIKIPKPKVQTKIETQIEKGKELAQRGTVLIQNKYNLREGTRDRDNFEISYEQWVEFTYESLNETFVSTTYAQRFKEKRSSKVEYVGSHWIPDVEYYLEKELIPKIDFLEILKKSLDEFEEIKTDELGPALKIVPFISSSKTSKEGEITLEDFLKHRDIEKLPLRDILRILNFNQSKAIMVFILSFIGGVFWFGYQIHSWKNDKTIYDLSRDNGNQKTTIENLQAEIKTLRENPSVISKLRWDGVWETETPVFRNVRIIFIQSGNKVNGKYKYTSKSMIEVEGNIEAEVADNVLIGCWSEFVGKSQIEGLLYFVISHDGQSFLGKYTRRWEGNQNNHVWAGKRVK